MVEIDVNRSTTNEILARVGATKVKVQPNRFHYTLGAQSHTGNVFTVVEWLESIGAIQVKS